MCLGYKIPSVGDGNGNFLQIFYAIILCIRFRSAVNKISFLAADYFSVEVLIGIQLIILNVNYFSCFGRQVEFRGGRDIAH